MKKCVWEKADKILSAFFVFIMLFICLAWPAVNWILFRPAMLVFGIC